MRGLIGEEDGMSNLTRRSVISGSLALAAAGAVARPYIANAAATTATVWWVQGFAQEEDIAFKKIVEEYQKAGYKIEDIPKTWDSFYDFFKDVQKKLREQGVRHVYGLGFQVTTNGGDPNSFFNQFLIGYGGQDIVTHDGKLHLDDPKVREAAIKALTYPTTAYKEGFVPPGAINWNDADDNNAFHAKQIVMDLDGSLSTEVAVLSQGKKEDYDNILTMGLALSNDGKPVPSKADNGCCLIPKGAKNVEVAKDFIKYFILPKVNNEFLKTELGRTAVAMPSIVKNEPF